MHIFNCNLFYHYDYYYSFMAKVKILDHVFTIYYQKQDMLLYSGGWAVFVSLQNYLVLLDKIT